MSNFKARPLNRKIFDGTGDMGVPKLPRPPITVPKSPLFSKRTSHVHHQHVIGDDDATNKPDQGYNPTPRVSVLRRVTRLSFGKPLPKREESEAERKLRELKEKASRLDKKRAQVVVFFFANCINLP